MSSENFNTSAVIEHIVNWLNSYHTNSGTQGFVVGVSGGIDSAVTSTLCAMTGAPTHCLLLPIHQASVQVDRKMEHVLQLQKRFPNVTYHTIDLTPTFETFKNSIEEFKNKALYDLALANTRSRLRMTTLYYWAGIHKALVAGTGNKVEDFGVGFYTKYGDGGVDLSPIADLMKSEVYALGRALGVPNAILQAAPTDGLFGDDRTDEQQLGASYDELEWAMCYDGSNEGLTNRQLEVLTIYQKWNNANRHKMLPIPVCEIPKSYKM